MYKCRLALCWATERAVYFHFHFYHHVYIKYAFSFDFHYLDGWSFLVQFHAGMCVCVCVIFLANVTIQLQCRLFVCAVVGRQGKGVHCRSIKRHIKCHQHTKMTWVKFKFLYLFFFFFVYLLARSSDLVTIFGGYEWEFIEGNANQIVNWDALIYCWFYEFAFCNDLVVMLKADPFRMDPTKRC